MFIVEVIQNVTDCIRQAVLRFNYSFKFNASNSFYHSYLDLYSHVVRDDVELISYGGYEYLSKN